ncbi:MAG: glycosyl transferase [Elusimicrobiaceae bacterium]|nr:glycosyl transferase [Elusimicrobiaceae bacterium]
MIPKIIHYCWIGNKPLPALAKKCIKSWQRVMPDYEINRWDETNYNFKKNKFMAQAYAQKKWGFVPDYARLDIIYNYGGIYLDTDVEVLKRFDEFLTYPAFCGFESEHFVALGLGFGSCKGNKVIKELMKPYENLDFTLEDFIVKQASLYTAINVGKWQKEGCVPSPLLQTQNLIKICGLKQQDKRQSLQGLEVFPTKYFCPRNQFNIPVKTPVAYSVHWYNASWLPWYYRAYAKLTKLLFKILGKNFIYLYKIKHKCDDIKNFCLNKKFF